MSTSPRLSTTSIQSTATSADPQEPYRILSANDAWTQLCGFSKEEAVGKTTKLLQGKLTRALDTH